MAYDFLGTFNSHQYARLAVFLQNQAPDVPGRLLHLVAEQMRIGTITFTYDAGGNPIAYNAGGTPPTSYIGKLVAAYEILGGDPLFDLQIRQMSQPVFMLPGTSTTPPQQLSSGDIVGQPGLLDGQSAVVIQQSKAWVPDVVQYKRENIERKVRRAMDYVDSLTAEINSLTYILSDATNPNSLQSLIADIQTLLNDPNYRRAYNDVNQDFHGKLPHAPFGAWDPGPSRTVAPNTVLADGGPSLAGSQVPQGNVPPQAPGGST